MRSSSIPRMFFVALAALAMMGFSAQGVQQTRRLTRKSGVAKNSWNGLTPLKSSAQDVARVLGFGDRNGDGSGEQDTAGPYKVEGGEITFSYLTASLAKIYRAPNSMVGRVFTIYFKPASPRSRNELDLGAGFKRCVDDQDRKHYYFVSDEGLAYQLRTQGDLAEVVIYQPSKAEIKRLAVNTVCVF